MNTFEKNLRFFLGNRIGNNALLFPVNYYRTQFNERIISKDKDICVEGFQRSGNSFFINVFKKNNPDAKVAHHLHSAVQLIKAVKTGIPAVLLTRKPEDSLASLVTWDERLKIGVAIRTYLDFCRTIYPYKDSCYIVKFDELIQDPDQIIENINQKFGAEFKHKNLSEKQIKHMMKESNKLDKSPMNSPYPNEKKNKRNKINRKRVMEHKHFKLAEKAYLNIIQ